MIWLALLALAAVVMTPLLLAATRAARVRSRQDAAVALHRAQLHELDADLAAGRLLPEEHAGAKLEVERRLLADAALAEAPAPAGGQLALALTAAGVPVAALLLYLGTAAHPGPPPVPAETVPDPAAAAGPTPAEAAREDQEIGILRNRLALMDPSAPRTLEGYKILGRAELDRQRLPEAVDAFRHVLQFQFDPTLGAETAEIMTEAAGRVTPEAERLFARALAEAPADAPWRPMASRRLAEARGS